MRACKRFFCCFQIQDLGNLLVELLDLLVQIAVARHLIVDRRLHLPVDDEVHQSGTQQRGDRAHPELLTLAFAFRLTPGQ